MGRGFLEIRSSAIRALSVWPHIVAVILAWLFLAALQWHNDGLWFQGDAPHHAANGVFWKDYLISGSLNPRDYALSYYARYPAINPVNYPPLFYLLEAAVFGIFHVSPYLAKGLVLVFALLTALYLVTWLRRWVAAEAGWVACLLLMTPDYVRWSHAVMLNVPATAISFAALYHARRWIESAPDRPAKRQLYLSLALLSMATITYYPSGMVAGIIAAWLLAFRRPIVTWNRRTIILSFVIALILASFFFVASRWAPVHLSFVTRSIMEARKLSGWIYYAKRLPELTGPFLLLTAGLGVVIGLARQRLRRESSLLLLFFLVNYLALSVLIAKERRYALLLCIPILCFCSIAFLSLAEWIGNWFGGGLRRFGVALGVVAVVACGVQARTASKTYMFFVQGIGEVAAYIKEIAPHEPVFYDGYFDGVFTFYIQAADPGFQRRVVLGSKLLYASALTPLWRYRSFVNSKEDIIQALQMRGGARWIVIETSKLAQLGPAARLLREAVKGPEFELIRSFPASGYDLRQIDVYRLKLDPVPTEDVDLPFPILGEGVSFKVRPVQR